MKKILAVLMALLLLCSASALAEGIAFEKAGDTFEYGHFTVQAKVLNGNAEAFNENADYTLYQIDDYTAEVPWADGYDANGVTSDNNTASMYVLLTANEALIVDLGNGASSTAGHFGEDNKDEAVLNALNEEYAALIAELVGDRKVSIAITHNHGDHIGYHTALANKGYTMYFPEIDYTANTDKTMNAHETYDLVLFTPGEFDIQLDDLTVKTVYCPGHTTGSTMFLITTPEVKYEYDEAGKAVASSAVYHMFSGDAIGSGGSVWIFSASAFNQLASAIDGVYDELATYTAYNDYLGGEAKNDATLYCEGGHGWQIINQFGLMDMDLDFIRNLRDLCKIVPTGEWKVSEDEANLAELLQAGYAATKTANSWLNTTIYYGSNMSDVAAINTTAAALNQAAGIVAE